MSKSTQRAEQLMAEWRVAYQAANGREPPKIRYASGWFNIFDGGLKTTKRRLDLELMVAVLRARPTEERKEG